MASISILEKVGYKLSQICTKRNLFFCFRVFIKTKNDFLRLGGKDFTKNMETAAYNTFLDRYTALVYYFVNNVAGCLFIYFLFVLTYEIKLFYEVITFCSHLCDKIL